MSKIKKPLLFVLALIPIALVGAYFSGMYTLSSLAPDMKEMLLNQAGSENAVFALMAIQTLGYALVCGFFGYLFSEKIGLMRPFRFEGNLTLRVTLISLICGCIFSLDAWTFAKWIPELKDFYAPSGSFDLPTWIASLLYGGVIEEVMLRLFLMSLLVLAVWKLFFSNRPTPPAGVVITANVIAAMLFSAGHLPSTNLFFGHLTLPLILRCFLLNGSAGLLFGRFYRKYGIQYAMLSHALFHVASRTIWLIFIP